MDKLDRQASSQPEEIKTDDLVIETPVVPEINIFPYSI